MVKVRLFNEGEYQAFCLPPGFEVDAKEFTVEWVGDALLLKPVVDETPFGHEVEIETDPGDKK